MRTFLHPQDFQDLADDLERAASWVYSDQAEHVQENAAMGGLPEDTDSAWLDKADLLIDAMTAVVPLLLDAGYISEPDPVSTPF